MNIGKETEQIEFKESTSEMNDAIEDICAILNKHRSGVLYFGVKDNGDVIGFQTGKDTESDISRKIREQIEPQIYPIIELINIDDKKVIKISFTGNYTPYSARGRYYIRVSDDSLPMTSQELISYIRNNDYSETWESQLTNKTPDDVDDDTLTEFYNSAKEAGRLDFQSYDKERLLAYLGLWDGKLNKAGYYLFGKNVNVNLKFAMYATTDKTKCIDLKEVKGNIYSLVDVALKYIYQNIRWEPIMTAGRRIDKPEIPEEAIREIVINSFAHAQYESNTEHEIDFYADRIEIYNPGAFPVSLTPKDFIDSNRKSILRNRMIGDALFRSKFVEKGGSGFQKVNQYCKINGNKWGYIIDELGFTFVFYRGNDKDDKSEENGCDYMENVVLEKIKNNPYVKKSELAQQCTKSEKTIQRILSELQSCGRIERIGNYRNGYWKVL